MTRVLVIDDDPAIRQLLCYTLADEGYQVDEAADGQAGLDLVRRHPPDLIILDMKMPGMDGWAFAQHYRHRYDSPAPIIVLTAARDAAQRGLDIQAESYMSKPFDLEALVTRIAGILGTSGAD